MLEAWTKLIQSYGHSHIRLQIHQLGFQEVATVCTTFVLLLKDGGMQGEIFVF